MKRKLLIVGAVLLSLMIIGGGTLWVTKPWVPDIVVVAPGPTGERIATDRVLGNYYPAKRASRGPAVLVLGGSEGGIGAGSRSAAVELQEAGFSVLVQSYFGGPGQPGQLERIPLETFDRGIAWLRAQRGVDPDRIGVAGQSKGSEAALLTGVRHPELAAVVASAPTSAVWQGIDWNNFDADSSWTSHGRPLPVVPYDGIPFLSAFTGDVGRVYRGALKYFAKYPDAMIPVERIDGRVLLVCGEEDELWPSCTMARQLRTRSSERNGPAVRILAYPGAGHGVFGPPVPRDDERYARLARWGGTPAGMNRVRADAWPKIIRFLRDTLR